MAGFGSGHDGGKEKLGVGLLRHGAHSYMRSGILPGCDKCLLGARGLCERFDKSRSDCTLGLEAQDLMMKQICSLPWIRGEHSTLVEEFCKDRVCLFLIDKWVMCVSPFKTDEKGDLDIRSILKMRWVVSNAMARLAHELGLSPAGRRELGLPLMDSDEIETVKLTAAEERFRTVPSQDSAAGDGNGHDPKKED